MSSTNTRVIMYTVKLNSCVRGYHVYKENWTAGIGKVLSCARNRGNREDPYAVAIEPSLVFAQFLYENVAPLLVQ